MTILASLEKMPFLLIFVVFNLLIFVVRSTSDFFVLLRKGHIECFYYSRLFHEVAIICSTLYSCVFSSEYQRLILMLYLIFYFIYILLYILSIISVPFILFRPIRFNIWKISATVVLLNNNFFKFPIILTYLFHTQPVNSITVVFFTITFINNFTPTLFSAAWILTVRYT